MNKKAKKNSDNRTVTVKYHSDYGLIKGYIVNETYSQYTFELTEDFKMKLTLFKKGEIVILSKANLGNKFVRKPETKKAFVKNKSSQKKQKTQTKQKKDLTLF